MQIELEMSRASSLREWLAGWLADGVMIFPPIFRFVPKIASHFSPHTKFHFSQCLPPGSDTLRHAKCVAPLPLPSLLLLLLSPFRPDGDWFVSVEVSFPGSKVLPLHSLTHIFCISNRTRCSQRYLARIDLTNPPARFSHAIVAVL